MAAEPITNHRNDTPLLIGVLAGIAYWFVDSAVHSVSAHDGNLIGQILSPGPASAWTRLFALVLFAAMGLYCRHTLSRLVQAETALAERDRTILHLANHDRLTGLPNRMLFNDRLMMALAHAQRHGSKVALMFMDIDGFKRINDEMGHAAGDTLLREFASRLTGCVRDCDTAARLGGDEFGAVLPQIVSSDEAVKVAVRIFSACSEPYDIGGRLKSVSFCTGIAIYPDDGEDASSLLRAANKALYRAKEPGMDSCQLFGRP